MCELCENSTLHVNIGQQDPTHTTTLRNAFVSEMNRRFKRISKFITKAIVENDVFGLSQSPFTLNQNTPMKRAFALQTKAQKITSFLNWLRQVEDAVLLEMQTTTNQYGNLQQSLWANVYLAKAFQQGTDRAKQEISKAGLGVVITDVNGFVFINPTTIEKLETIFLRAYTDLRGITTTMDEQISRILAEGLFEGQSPITLARMINSAIIGGGKSFGIDIPYITKTGNRGTYFMPGRRRAEILARTEIIRAHHIATVQEYRNWELEGVYVLAEWFTAGDARVCADCSSLQGTIWSLDEIENLIPLHPQCRCIALPYVDKTRTKIGGD